MSDVPGPLGASPVADGRTRFVVWAPRAERVEVELLGPARELLGLSPAGDGYHAAETHGAPPGSRYRIVLDGRQGRPDPCSAFQPEGVHGASQVVDPRFAWTDAGWRGLELARHVVYELHVGTFTNQGTFEAIVGRLDDLAELGVTAIELMPVAQFPGERNWGYDGVGLFAVQASYGGPLGLKRLVDACHARGLALLVDVVYNHLGPEGNYLAEFGPYFTDAYRTAWGPAVNFDGPDSDEVRRFFVDHALRLVDEFHVDGLRLDAVHAIRDHAARPFLAELAEAVAGRAAALGRHVHLFAESDLNDSRLVRPASQGGLGLDAQWSDDVHHALHALVTGERDGYYVDFGRIEDLARAYSEGYAYTGHRSRFRRRRHGSPAADVPAERFVVCAQNHDQVGNRMLGERLAGLVGLESLKLVAGAVLLSPFVPLLFMGEEYGETAPFLYFVSHSDPDLIDAVRNGRGEEFREFAWRGTPPDPQDPVTFERSRLEYDRRQRGTHGVLRAFHRELLRLRRERPSLGVPSKEGLEVGFSESGRTVVLHRRHAGDAALVLMRFAPADGSLDLPAPAGRWRLVLDSAARQWDGPGGTVPARLDGKRSVPLAMPAPSVAVYVREVA